MEEKFKDELEKFIPMGLSQRSIESGMRLKLGHEVQQKLKLI